MKKYTAYSLVFLATFLVLYSCAEEQNFDQFDALQLRPRVASSIFYFESDEATINAAATGVFYDQLFTFEAFSEPFISERVLEGIITYQIENSTSKPITANVVFVDENDMVLDTEVFNIVADPAPIFERQVSYGPAGKSLDILRNTVSIRVQGENLGDNSSTSNALDPKIFIRTSAEFLLELR